MKNIIEKDLLTLEENEHVEELIEEFLDILLLLGDPIANTNMVQHEIK